MTKTFLELMDSVLEEYADARKRQMPGVDQKHYYKTLKIELSMQVQNWFIKHVEAIHDHSSELKTTILQTNTSSKDVPKDRTGVNL